MPRASWTDFGSALASADFDHDGRADLAIGVPRDSVGTSSHAGSVNVLYGSASGLTAAGDQRWNQGALPDDPETGDGFGASLATGDFDEDGYPDLAIGAPGEVLGAGEAPGSVTILFGSPSGLQAGGAVVLTRADTGAPYLPDTPHGFGYALATGDLDGDGDADLAVGSPASGSFGDDPSRPLVDGDVIVLYGGPVGPSTSGTQSWTQDTTDVPGDGEAGDWFGSSLETGDFDDDGYDDLAIGARFDRVNGVRSGAVDVLYGTASGLSAADAQLWHQDAAGVPSAAEAGDDFGHAIASGHLDGDGFDDLAIGAPGEAIGSGEPGAGVVNVVYGSSAGLGAAGAQLWSQASAGVPGVPEATDIAWDAFGSSLAIADYGRSRAGRRRDRRSSRTPGRGEGYRRGGRAVRADGRAQRVWRPGVVAGLTGDQGISPSRATTSGRRSRPEAEMYLAARRIEAVAEAPDGDQVDRLARLAFDLGPQPVDVDVHGPRSDLAF